MALFNSRSLLFIVLLGIVQCGSKGGSISIPIENESDLELLGGETTVQSNTEQAFSLPAANLSQKQERDFKVGNSFFETDWVISPSSTTARDGLGPLFNARSCSACHAKDGRGSPPIGDQDAISLLLRLSIPGQSEKGEPLPEPNYGVQLNPFANPGIQPEGKFIIVNEEINGQFDDGEPYSLLKPNYHLIDLAYGEPHPQMMVSPRIAPQMIGLGLLEAVDEEDILKLADPDDQDGDGISGRPNIVWDFAKEGQTLGRFGWKANVANVGQQVAGAFLGDIGISSRLFSNQNCTDAEVECLLAPTGIEGAGSFEIEDDILNFVIFYSKTLAVPAQRNVDDPQVKRGREVFLRARCDGCHNTEFVTSDHYPLTEMANQTIRPYTDLLLHDMGEGLADGRPDYEANGNEWRTPPLWGVGLVEKVNGHTRFLHDGRARNLSEAILWHGGEAQASKEKFMVLPKSEREALLTFLRSL